MNNNNNQITPIQWELILEAFHTHCKENNVKEDEPYIGDKFSITPSGSNKRRQFIYDNYDRYTSPGLEFVQIDKVTGSLFVYNSSEQAHAPITFQQGMEIADNFFLYKGTSLSESIVCDYQMQ